MKIGRSLMRLLLLLIILLAFPIIEVVLMVQIAERYGWEVLLAYLLLSALCGWMLIQGERMLAVYRILETLRSGEHPVRAVLTSAKTLIAGALLILPGVLSDVIAVVILLLPSPRMKKRVAPENGVIEGEWRRED
jgi:UPF0716 protein FxsA